MCHAFFDSSHRARFLKSNAILNPPLMQTPLFAIQLMHIENIPLFATNPESLVIFSTSSAYFVTSTKDLDNSLRRKVSRSKAFRELRLEIPLQIFKSSDASERDLGQRCKSLESLYDAITMRCSTLLPTFTAKQLREEIIPRPSDPLSQRAGIPLGTPFPKEEDCMSNAPSRMGEKRRRLGKQETEEAGVADDGNNPAAKETSEGMSHHWIS